MWKLENTQTDITMRAQLNQNDSLNSSPASQI